MDWLSQELGNEYNHYIDMAVEHGVSMLGAFVILAIGLWAAGFAERMSQAAMDKTQRLDKTVSLFLSTLIRYAIIVFTGLAVLDQFGVQTTSLVALLGAAGLAVGLALQGTLSNLAAGVMLLIFRPFKVGDFVDVGGQSGTVMVISLFTTHINTLENLRIIVPNGSIWGASIKNYTANETRRMDVIMSIDYGDDIDKAFKVMDKVVMAEDRILKEPAPMYYVVSLAASSVDVAARVWCNRDDLFVLKSDLLRAFKDAFGKAGLSIPYPHQVLIQRKD